MSNVILTKTLGDPQLIEKDQDSVFYVPVIS